MTERHKKTEIPEFKTRQEAAEWFDTHDTGDYEDEFKPIKVRFARNLSSVLAVRLDAETLKKLRNLAAEKGIGPTTLVRMWVMEHVKEHELAARRHPTNAG